MVIFALVLYTVGSVFCAWLAGDKGGNAAAWGFFGLIFGLLALIAIAAMPLVQDEVTKPRLATGEPRPYDHRRAEGEAARHTPRDL